MAQLAPRSTSKASDVLCRMRSDIVAGRLAPGQKLSMSLLKSRYGSGMTPLREALCHLCGAGLVELTSHKGFRVAPVSIAELEHIVAVRNHLELYALGLAVQRGDRQWRRRLQYAAAQFDSVAAKIGDQRPIDQHWEDMHRNYHFALTDAPASHALLQFFEQLYDKFDRYRRIAVPIQAYMALPARDHNEITAAAISGKAAIAQALLKRHIEDIVDVVRVRLAESLAAANGAAGNARADEYVFQKRKEDSPENRMIVIATGLKV